jgi:hyperosmotically inducible protein
MILMAAAAGALGVVQPGCSHSSGATASNPPLAQPVETSKATFAEAYAAVEKGEARAAQSGDFLVQRGSDGKIEVINTAASASAGQSVQDNWITAKLLSAYAVEGYKSTRLHVGTKNGVVTLGGTLDSEDEVRRTVNRALRIKGVRAVKSELVYPTTRPGGETFVPSESAPPQH